MSGQDPLRIAVLVKQIPKFECMTLGPDGRLERDGIELELNAYCRRAVSKGVEIAGETGGSCAVFTLGPPSAEDVLREAIAGGADRGVLITDPVCAGSDTLATARALAAAVRTEGPFDLVLAGRNSVDADTGQVPPQLAQMLDFACSTGVRDLSISEGVCEVRCEHDDEWVTETVALPAVLTCAERLCDPTKRPPEERAAVAAEKIKLLDTADLGAGPWGEAGSPTTVGEVRVLEVDRRREILTGSVDEQVAAAIEILVDREALEADHSMEHTHLVPESVPEPDAVIGVVVEPDRDRITREMLGAASHLAGSIRASVVAVGPGALDPDSLGSWGGDAVVEIRGATVEEDVAAGLTAWAGESAPWAILAPGTAWGREVASRAAASLDAGLTGDAVELDVEDGRLTAWKPAFGGATVAAIGCSSPVQMATVRAGVLVVGKPRPPRAIPVQTLEVEPRNRVIVHERVRDDDGSWVAHVSRVISVGMGVSPDQYDHLDSLLKMLDAELIATRKVTDRGYLPRARQVGITGHSISPKLCIALGTSGKFNHMVGLRRAGTIMAINPDPGAFVWDFVDVGIVARWEEAVPLLEKRIAEILGSV